MEANWVARGKTIFIVFICLLFACRTVNDVAGRDVAAFDSAYRASKAIEAATHNGTNYATFIGLVQTYATEIEIAKDRAKSDRGKELLRLYSDGLSKYDDSRKFWSIAIGSESYGYIDLGKAGAVKGAELQPLISAYKLTVYNGPGIELGIPTGIKVDEALSTIWSAAEIPVNKANALYISQSK